MRLDNYDSLTGIVTAGRGILDTVPTKHLAGSVVGFLDIYAISDEIEYVDGETINVKIQTISKSR